MESFENRLSRFLNGSPDEIFGTILDSISNFFLPELQVARERDLTAFTYLGTHAVIQTVTEKMFGFDKPSDGTRFYLTQFVDGESPDRKYSDIADEIHAFRNTLAHMWFSKRGHSRAFDYRISEGWKKDGDTLILNPRIYLDDFLAAFGRGGRIWNARKMVDPATAVVQKFRYLADWLELPRKDEPIRDAIAALRNATDDESRAAIDADLKGQVKARYGLK